MVVLVDGEGGYRTGQQVAADCNKDSKETFLSISCRCTELV